MCFDDIGDICVRVCVCVCVDNSVIWDIDMDVNYVICIICVNV